MMKKIKPFYINGMGAMGEGMDSVAETREEMHKTIDKFLDKECTVITIMKGYPGAP